jgi:TRAP-type C4-dicarboxylate transport system substrate-binding protein
MSATGILVLVDLMIAGMQRYAALSSIYRQMRAEGRTELTPAEWAAVQAADDDADAKLAAEVAKAKAEGR